MRPPYHNRGAEVSRGLTDRQALAARFLWFTTSTPARTIARHLGVSASTIDRLVRGERYTHLPIKRDAVVAAWEALLRGNKECQKD